MDPESALLLSEKGIRADLSDNQEGDFGECFYGNPEVTFFAPGPIAFLPKRAIREDPTLQRNARFGKTVLFELPSEIIESGASIQQILIQIPIPGLTARYTRSVMEALRESVDQIDRPLLRDRLQTCFTDQSADLILMEQVLQQEQASSQENALLALIESLLDQPPPDSPQPIVSPRFILDTLLDRWASHPAIRSDLAQASVPFGEGWRAKLISDSIALGLASSLATTIPIGFVDTALGTKIVSSSRTAFLEQLMPIVFLGEIEQIVDRQFAFIARIIQDVSDRYPESYTTAILLPGDAIYQYRSAQPYRQLNLLYLQHFHHLNKLSIATIEEYYRGNLSRSGQMILRAFLMMTQINLEMVVTQISSELNQIYGDLLLLGPIDPNESVYWLGRHAPPMERLYQMIHRGWDEYQIADLATILQDDLPEITATELIQIRAIGHGIYDTLQSIWRGGSEQLLLVAEPRLFQELLSKIPIDVMCASYQLDSQISRRYEQIYQELSQLGSPELATWLSPDYQSELPSIFRYQGLPYAKTRYRSETGIEIIAPLQNDRSVKTNTYHLAFPREELLLEDPSDSQSISEPTEFPEIAWTAISHLALVGAAPESWATVPNRFRSELEDTLVSWIQSDLVSESSLAFGTILRDLQPDRSRLQAWSEQFRATRILDHRPGNRPSRPNDGIVAQVASEIQEYHAQYRSAISHWAILSAWQQLDYSGFSTVQLAQEAILLQEDHPSSSLWERAWLRTLAHSQIVSPALDLALAARIAKVVSRLTGPARDLWDRLLDQKSERTPLDLEHYLLMQLAIAARMKEHINGHKQRATILALVRYAARQFDDSDQIRDYLLSRMQDSKLVALISSLTNQVLPFAIQFLVQESEHGPPPSWPAISLEEQELEGTYLARIRAAILDRDRPSLLELDQIRIRWSEIVTRPETPRIAWVDRLGYYLLQSIQLLQNGLVVSELTSQSLDYHNRVGDSATNSNRAGLDRILGNRDQLSSFTPGPKPSAILTIPILFAGSENGSPIPIVFRPGDRYQIRAKLRDREGLGYSDRDSELDPIELTIIQAILIPRLEPVEIVPIPRPTVQYRRPAGKSNQSKLPESGRSVGIAAQLAVHLNPNRAQTQIDYLPKEIQWNHYGDRSRWSLASIRKEHLQRWHQLTSYPAKALVRKVLEQLLADPSLEPRFQAQINQVQALVARIDWPAPNYHWDRLEQSELLHQLDSERAFRSSAISIYRRSKIWTLWPSEGLHRWKESLFYLWGISEGIQAEPSPVGRPRSVAFRAYFPRWTDPQQQEEWLERAGAQIFAILGASVEPVDYPRHLISVEPISPIQTIAFSEQSEPIMVPFSFASAIYSGFQIDCPGIAKVVHPGSDHFRYQLGPFPETMLYFWIE